MIRKSGYLNWPPGWTTTHLHLDDKPTGEIGTLEDVVVSPSDRQQDFHIYAVSGLSLHGVRGL
jgi:hypothetical protein